MTSFDDMGQSEVSFFDDTRQSDVEDLSILCNKFVIVEMSDVEHGPPVDKIDVCMVHFF